MANTAGNLLNSLSDPAQDPAVQVENQGVLGFHALLEDEGHETNLNDAVHGLTNAGETLGLGKIGGDNLITDTAQAPGDVLNGDNPQSVVSNIVTDAGQTTSAAGDFVQGVGTDAGHPTLVQDIVNGVSNSADGLTSGGLGELGNVGGIAGGGDNGGGGANGGGGNGDGSAISAGIGQSGDSPIVNAGVLATPDGQAPIGVAAGNGANIADVNALQGDGNGDGHIVGAGAGAPGDPILNTGVLTTGDGQNPVNADVGNGDNLANASLLSHSDALQFPDMGGAGTDALNGALPTSLAGLVDGTDAPQSGATDQSLLDAHTDGGSLVQTNDDHNSLVGVNDHALV